MNSDQMAARFLREGRGFRLGPLLTESPHPKTMNLSQTLQGDIQAGLRMLGGVDQDILPAVERVFEGHQFEKLTRCLAETLQRGGRIFLAGCGSTGRLSILLEAAWRKVWKRVGQDRAAELPPWADAVHSVMAGGDFALIKSVEGFEDFGEFGRRQLSESGLTEGDLVVAITEGGETPFVIGAAWAGLEAGAGVFFVYNNPTDLLRQHVRRSREVIDEPRITKLDLSTGPMAIRGSTRMQATTIELLVVGAALEAALCDALAEHLPAATRTAYGLARRGGKWYRACFESLLGELIDPASIAAQAQLVALEEQTYTRQRGVTYLACEFLLDVLTDVTERSPTFALPALRKCDDTVSAPAWTTVANPLGVTEAVWRDMLGRKLRGLSWSRPTYQALGAPQSIRRHPPALDAREIHKFRIGTDGVASAPDVSERAAVAVLAGEEASQFNTPGHRLGLAVRRLGDRFGRRAVLSIGPVAAGRGSAERFHVGCHWPASPVDLFAHLAVKMVLNNVSTATMGRLGRIWGNSMVFVQPSNGKLIDRGTRIVSELTGLCYADACVALHRAMAELEPRRAGGEDAGSPVALAIQRVRAEKESQARDP